MKTLEDLGYVKTLDDEEFAFYQKTIETDVVKILSIDKKLETVDAIIANVSEDEENPALLTFEEFVAIAKVVEALR